MGPTRPGRAGSRGLADRAPTINPGSDGKGSRDRRSQIRSGLELVPQPGTFAPFEIHPLSVSH